MNSQPRRHPPESNRVSRRLLRSASLIAGLALAASQAACVVHPRTVYVVEQPPPQTVVVEAGADTTVVVDDFYQPLGNYGVWVYTPAYGRVWQPAPDMAGEGFVPYGSHGRWVVNADGDWVFVSTYERQWGWATYHYGRWAWTDYYGWVWVPGTAWAPSWVEWRYGGGYVGWVPMGPPGYVVVHEHWVFVAEGHVGATSVIEHRLPPERARDAYVAASPIIEVKGSSKWKAGPPSHHLINAGVEVTRADVVAPPAGWVRTQAHVVNEGAADRRASGMMVTAPKVRPGATPPPGVAVVQAPQQQPGRPDGAMPGQQPSMQPQGRPDGAMPGQQPSMQPQGRPDGAMPGQQPSMPQPAPNPTAGQRPGAMPQPMPQPMPSQPSVQPRPSPQPMPQPMPQPQPRPSAAPTPRPATPPAAAPKPAPRPTTTPPKPAPPKKRR